VDGRNAEVFPTHRSFSNYAFLEDRGLVSAPIKRLMSQARMHEYSTLVIEEVSHARDLREEDEDVGKCLPGFAPDASLRLSFFKASFERLDQLEGVAPEDFLGYAIVRCGDPCPDENGGICHRPRIYESVLRYSRRINNFVRGAPLWSCRVDGCDFEVEGYLFAQQNAITNCCAHVALRTVAARYHSAGDLSYRQINDIVGIDHIGKKAAAGLDHGEMVTVLESVGASCHGMSYETHDSARPPFQKYLYGSIESGFPALLLFKTASADLHAIPVLGHTFNEDTWAPRAERGYFHVGHRTRYAPSESWVSMYVAHDDNYGSNFCLPRHYLREPLFCPDDRTRVCQTDRMTVKHVIGTFPASVQLDAVEAEVIAADFFFKILRQLPSYAGPWGDRLKQHVEAGALVLRPLLLTHTEYLDHLATLKTWEGDMIAPPLVEALRSAFPDGRFWMVELSLRELFSANRRKVGEVVISAENDTAHGARDPDSMLCARLPGCFGVYVGGGAISPQYRFGLSGAQGHVQMYECSP
jgi:hypothetical protein